MLRFLGFIFLLILLAIPFGVYYYRAPLVEKALSTSFHTPVTLEEVQLGWNKVTLKGFRVPQAQLFVKRIAIETPISSLWQDEIAINSLLIDEPHLLPFIPKFSTGHSKRTFTIDKLTILNMHLPLGKKVPYLEWHGIGKRTPFNFDAMITEIISRALASEKMPKEVKIVGNYIIDKMLLADME